MALNYFVFSMRRANDCELIGVFIPARTPPFLHGMPDLGLPTVAMCVGFYKVVESVTTLVVLLSILD